jgi:sulfur transfer protein SufE
LLKKEQEKLEREIQNLTSENIKLMNLLENEKNLKNLAESRLKEIQECNNSM